LFIEPLLQHCTLDESARSCGKMVDAVMNRTPVVPAASYRWTWPYVPDAPQVRGIAVVAAVKAYGALVAVFALPPVQDATGVGVGAIIALCAVHATWMGASWLVLRPRHARSRRAFDVQVLGNALASSSVAAAIPVVAEAPGSVLWGALVLYATMNGAIIDFEPSIALQLIHVGAALATIPIFHALGVTEWSIAGPVLAATFAALGYHLAAVTSTTARVYRREIQDRKLARDLHDVVGSTLGTVKLYADQLGAAPLSDVAQAGMNDLRAVLDGLAPAAELEDGIAAIARRLAPEPIDVRITGVWPAKLPGPLRIAIARITHEAVSNAVRHGNARAIEVASATGAGELRIEIRDDGCGFDLERAMGLGRGLESMRSRAAELGGDVEITSRQGAGSVVAVMFAQRRSST
jgi:signal transduction histidine kinase